MTTFHLYIVFRLWFWLSLAFGTVTWRGFWQLPAERNKPSTLSTFKWSLSHRWEAWCMLMKMGCVCTGLRGMGCGVGGWVAAGKTFLIYPLVPKWQKPCQEQGGTSKWRHSQSLHLHRVGTQTVHQGAIWIQKRFAARGKKETFTKRKREKKKNGKKRQEEIRSGYRS